MDDNIDDKSLSVEENLNNKNINNNNNNNINQEEDYLTDSDIEDPKYLPGGNYPPNENQLIENNLNTDNFIDPSQNQMFLQSQVMNLENENMISNQNLEQIENENNQLKAELMEYKKKFDKKEGINKEFKLMPVAFKQRFNEYEKRNALLQKNINDLEMQLKNKDIELAESLKEKNKSETAIRNANIYKQYMDELQNEFKDKVNKLNKKYIEKEKGIKSEFEDEINKKRQKVEELRIENEKLKYDLSHYKMDLQTLNHQLEEKDTYSNINQKEKEIVYLKEKISELEKNLDQKKSILQENISNYENVINEIKQENITLQNELNQLRNQKKENDIKLNHYKHSIQMLNNELNQNKNFINNKTLLIEQLTFQLDEMQKSLNQWDVDIQNYDLEKQNEINEYNNQIEEINNAKNEIQAENEVYREYLEKAIDNMKQLNDQIVENYGSLEEELGLQMNENQQTQKKYKDMLKKIKKKQNNLTKQNEELKMKINSQDMQFGFNGHMTQTMLLKSPQIHHPNSFLLENNNIDINTNLTNNININNDFYGILNSGQDIDENNDNDNRQKKTLDEFKGLLRKMDEKLMEPINDNRGYN